MEYERYRFFNAQGKQYAAEGYEEEERFIIDIKERNGELIQSYKLKTQEGADRILKKILWVAKQTEQGGKWSVRDILDEAEELFYK